MLFSINNDTFAITGTRGDSGCIAFLFDQDMEGCTACFVVKEYVTTPDEDAYIHISKTFSANLSTPPTSSDKLFEVVFTPEITQDIPIVTEDCPPKYDEFIWGLKVTRASDNFAQTVVPTTGATYPKFKLYYDIEKNIT